MGIKAKNIRTHTRKKQHISCQASTHLPTHIHAKHAIYATHNHCTAWLCLCQTHYCAVCVLKQIIQERNISQTQQLFSTPCLGADKGRHWDLWPQMHSLILSRESITGLASLVMNYSTSMPPWVPVVGSAETESRGFDWQSLWSHNSHALYDQRFSEGGKTRALVTLSPSELSLFYFFHLYLSIHLAVFVWTLNFSHLCFLLFFSLLPHNISFVLNWLWIKQRPLKLELKCIKLPNHSLNILCCLY